MLKYYKIFFLIFIKFMASEQLIIFDPYFVNQYKVNGIATFLNNLIIENDTITINGNFQLNNNKFFNNTNNKIIINSNNFKITGLPETSIGINFLALDNNNNVSIIKNQLLLDRLLSNNYSTVYANNIIGKNNMPLKIGNNTTENFFIGNYQEKLNDINFYSYQTIINSINSIDNTPIIIANKFNSNNSLYIDGNLNISSNILADNIKINQTLTITDPVIFSNIQVNGNCSIENNNYDIVIVKKNGILDIKNNIIIQGLPLYNNLDNDFKMLVLDKNNQIYQTSFNESVAINAINQELYIKANEIITVDSPSGNILLNGNLIMLDSISINQANPIMTFNFPINFNIINSNIISQLIFKDNLIINNIPTINNLFCASNNNSLCNVNNNSSNNSIIFNSNQMILINSNNMDIYQGKRLVIGYNNIIGIEGINNINKKNTRNEKNINNKIKLMQNRIHRIKNDITNLKKIKDDITIEKNEKKNIDYSIVSAINNFLKN